MGRVALLIDGGYFLKRLPTVRPDIDASDSEAVARSIDQLIRGHLDQLNEIYKVENVFQLLYRTFYYDARPYDQKAHTPIDKRPLDYAKSSQAAFRKKLFNTLHSHPNLAVRLGEVRRENSHSWILKMEPQKKLLNGDLERMGGKKGITDSRFNIERPNGLDQTSVPVPLSLVTRSSDGQMLFLANMVSKMKQNTRLGSRIAEVHNGSSLFTGDAGQGESNIRRWIIENDWLEAIVALPLNMFYNTGIATYIWVLTNRKPAHRQGKVQLIDATSWQRPLRKNLGKKNCELSDEDIRRICDTFLAFEETEHSKIFDNAAFGYRKVTVERPLRLKGVDSERVWKSTEIKGLKETCEIDENAPPVIRKVHKKGTEPDPLSGLFETVIAGKPAVVEYEPDTNLRDTEQIPLLEEGGIEAFLQREVLPYAPDAWYTPESVKVGYEISFSRHFYKPQPMRTLEDIRADILALEKETEGLLSEIIGG